MTGAAWRGTSFALMSFTVPQYLAQTARRDQGVGESRLGAKKLPAKERQNRRGDDSRHEISSHFVR